MKKAFLTLTIIALAVSASNTFARNVSLQEAQNAAKCYMNKVNTMHKVDVSDLTLIHQINNPQLNIPACYFFNVSDWGWVIISGSTAMDPIVAYNDNGRTLDIETVPQNMMWWVEGFASLISAMQVEDVEQGLEDDKAWAELYDNTNNTVGGAKAQHILLDEEWGQGDDNGATYNMYCPTYDGVYTVTGCVATALSQIIHYYKYPISARGTQSYYWYNPDLNMTSPGVAIRLNFDTMRFNYSLMPNIVSTNTALNKRQEVARLCYAVGVAMKMDYGTSASGGSGAVTAYVPGTMHAYFKYNTCTQLIRSNVGTETFINGIRNDLKLNRPIYMSGASQNHVGNDDRHAWVCCGYQDSTSLTAYKKYYMNWGWSGSGNGWFNLYDNTANGMRIPNMGYTFTNEQTAMIGLIPPHPDSSNVDFWDHVGIENAETPQLLDAYPNPATFNVTIPYSAKTVQTMSIYNIEGKLIEQHQLQPSNDNIVIDVTRMPAGIYIYRVGGASGKFNVMK